MMISFIVANTKINEISENLENIFTDGEKIDYFDFYSTNGRSATKLNHFFQLKHSDANRHLRLLYCL